MGRLGAAVWAMDLLGGGTFERQDLWAMDLLGEGTIGRRDDWAMGLLGDKLMGKFSDANIENFDDTNYTYFLVKFFCRKN